MQDEYQDTNSQQLHILRLLCADAPQAQLATTVGALAAAQAPRAVPVADSSPAPHHTTAVAAMQQISTADKASNRRETLDSSRYRPALELYRKPKPPPSDALPLLDAPPAPPQAVIASPLRAPAPQGHQSPRRTMGITVVGDDDQSIY